MRMVETGLRDTAIYKTAGSALRKHLSLYTMKGTLLLLALLVTGELGFQTSENGNRQPFYPLLTLSHFNVDLQVVP